MAMRLPALRIKPNQSESNQIKPETMNKRLSKPLDTANGTESP